MENLVIIVIVSLLISYLFYVVISNKWLPSKYFLISFLIGCSLVPIAVLLEKGTLLNTLVSNNKNLEIFTFVIIEEFLKIASLFLFIKFNKNNKNNFIELLGLGIGFGFVESILYSYGSGLGLFSGLLNTSLLVLILRSTGALILHTLTIAVVSLSILYFKNKIKIIIYTSSISLILIVHFFFNFFTLKGDGENFLTIFSITWLLFLISYTLYLYFDFKSDNSFKVKKFIKKIAIFFGKFLFYIVFIATILVLVDSGFGGLKKYSEKDIEQAKIAQQDIIKSIDGWSENLPEGYEKYPDELGSIIEKLNIINNHYTRIILITKEEGNLSADDLSFLRSNGDEILEEVNILIDNLNVKVSVDNLKIGIENLKKEKKENESLLHNNIFANNIKNEILIYQDIIDELIKNEEEVIIKLKSDINITSEESDNLMKSLDEKISEYEKQNKLIINLIEENS